MPGVIGRGTTNTHWYQLGILSALTTPWNPEVLLMCHPEVPDKAVTGVTIPDFQEALQIVTRLAFKWSQLQPRGVVTIMCVYH